MSWSRVRERAPLDVVQAAAVALLCVTPVWLGGCGDEGCLDGGDDCIVPSPCAALGSACDGGEATVRVLAKDDALVEGEHGAEALASPGDFVLQNDRIVAVIDALDHPHYLAPTGGALLDLRLLDGHGDELNSMFQATGLLPGDAAHYTEARVLQGEGFAAVQLLGHLDGHPDQPIATRYEVRPCEAGVRVRTEVVNREPDPAVWSVADGFYWGGGSHLPFAPRPGGGFAHPKLELEAASDAYRDIPLLASLPQRAAGLAYGCVPCNAHALSGFHAVDISAVGIAPRIVQPRDYVVYERFVLVADADSVAPAVDAALEARRQLFGESFARLSGRVVVAGDAALGHEALCTLQVVELGEGGRRTPRTQVTPDAQGRFSVSVPSRRDYELEVYRFGRLVERREVRVDDAARALDAPIELEPAASLVLRAQLDGAEAEALVFVEPADEAPRERVVATRFGVFDRCAPWLGPPGGASPACNRVLVHGETQVALPPGSYELFAMAGPFATLAHQRVQLSAADSVELDLSLASLPLVPEGALSADFHVHGGASFDSSLPDHERVLSLLAARLDVIAATDHDVVHDYREAIDGLDAGDRLIVVPGVELTGHILFDLVPHAAIPQVVGHWNVWPLAYDAQGAWRGAPWDELAEPGLLFTRAAQAGWPEQHGVLQLNHPWGDADFGRDQGFPRALGLDLRPGEPLPRDFDGSAQSLFRRTPHGARFGNADYHTQEVMNGVEGPRNQAYRAFWFALLERGIVRAGTANSDSHGLSRTPVGSPRTLVFAPTTRDDFDLEAFDHAVREGRMIGTSGPVIELELRDAGAVHGPSLDVITPGAAAELWLRVSAAPWVPVDEIRVVVNGEVVRRFDDVLEHPADAFGQDGLLRYEGTLGLAELLEDVEHDAFIVVEAGAPLLPAADLDCDGIPDTGDNDGDGVIDRHDVDVDADAETPFVERPEVDPTCLDDVGPLRAAPLPLDPDDPGYAFSKVVELGRPAAFTNPLLLDLDGGGFTGTR